MATIVRFSGGDTGRCAWAIENGVPADQVPTAGQDFTAFSMGEPGDVLFIVRAHSAP